MEDILELSLLDNLIESILLVDMEGEIIYYNRAFLILTKSSPRRVITDTNIDQLINFSELNIKEAINRCSSEEQTIVVGERYALIQHTGKNVYLEIRCVPVGRHKALVCFRDLSIEKSLHDKYKKSQSRLKELESGSTPKTPPVPEKNNSEKSS
ncbi:MAG: PAS domain-containing protein [Bacteriovoracaceae bacterium]|nr:PAS domain-containing protein [Bacteriovoracaceae bacterium]